MIRAIPVLLIAGVASAQSSFTVVGLPDTQVYSELYPEIFESQTAWIIEQRVIRDIRFVSHYGDVVEHGDDLMEWLIGDAAMAYLDDDDLPYGVSAGNHDVTPNGSPFDSYAPENYLEFFGPSRFEGCPWYIGSSPSGMSSYQMISGGGLDFLMLNIECDTPIHELQWAQGILDRSRDIPVFLTTHRYMQDAEDFTGDVPLVPSGRYPSIWYTFESPYTPGGIESNEFFNWFIRRNPNIFMVNCGHFSEEYRQQSQNVEGRVVHEVLADYQSDPSGGGGFLRIMQFDVANNRIDVQSYSPWFDDFYTDDESDFSLDVVFEDYRTDLGFAIFHDGINGYSNTRDTWINEDEPDESYGSDDTRDADDDAANSIFSDYQGQALIRFEEIIGEPGQEGRIPSNAKVVRAVISLELAEDVDRLFNPEFYVWEMTREWEENSTWNSLGGGLTAEEDLGEYLGMFMGDNDPDSDTLRRIDITPAVQRWVNGQPNYGIAILPEIISGNDDGISIWTREASNALLRPTLEVWFESDIRTNPADLNGDGEVNGGDLALILVEWGEIDSIADINADGIVDGGDLALVLVAWTE